MNAAPRSHRSRCAPRPRRAFRALAKGAPLLVVLAALAGAAAAQSPFAEKTRSFHLGFTPFPYDFVGSAPADTYDWIEEHADLVLFHMDSGVPWPEALAGTPYHPNLVAEVDFEVANVRPGQKVYVSATPQSNARAGALALYRAADTGLPLPPGWETKTLDDPDVIEAFTNWCRYLIERFDPDYFAYAIECNGGFTGPTDPELQQFLVLVQAVYPTLKLEHPELPVFLTVQTGGTNATRADFLAQTALLLPFSDLVGISSYPFLRLRLGAVDSFGDPDTHAGDLLTALLELCPEKPMAITETGYIAEDLVIPEFGISQEGRAAWQTKYVGQLLREVNRYQAEFVVWFVSRDYDLGLQTLENLGVPIDPAFLIWRDTGLLNGAGNPRPALAVWDRWLARRRLNR